MTDAQSSAAVDRIGWVSDLVRLEIVLWDRIDGRLREQHDLALTFFESLHAVSRAPGGSMRVGDLARALRVTIGGTSKLVDRIEQAGLLTRLPDPDDRRAARVALTGEGRNALAAAIATYEAEAASYLDAVLSPEEQQQLHGYVTRLLAVAEPASPDPGR